MDCGVTPKVSVIVVTYNQEDTIARTLESVLMQKCRFPFEIQIGDDCSTDGTSDICARYAARYPGIIHHHRNTRNEGVRDNYFDALLRCNAPYIADCAGDDYWTDPLKLQKEADILDSRPDVALVHTGWEYVDSQTGVTSPSEAPSERASMLPPVAEKGELFMPLMTNRGIPVIHLCTAMYRKSVFLKEYAADPELFRRADFTCEDRQLIILYAREGAVAYIPDVTMRYSKGHDSVSAIKDLRRAFDFYFGSLKLSVYLADKYNVPSGAIGPVHAADSAFLFAMAFLIFDRERIAQLTAFLRLHHIRLPLKSRLLLPCVRNMTCWRAAAWLKAKISHLRK